MGQSQYYNYNNLQHQFDVLDLTVGIEPKQILVQEPSENLKI